MAVGIDNVFIIAEAGVNHNGSMELAKKLIDIAKADESHVSSEAPIYIEIDRLADEEAMQSLQVEIANVLNDVRVSVADWQKMMDRVRSCLNDLENNPPKVDQEELNESRDFLRWLINNNFTFIILFN